MGSPCVGPQGQPRELSFSRCQAELPSRMPAAQVQLPPAPAPSRTLPRLPPEKEHHCFGSGASSRASKGIPLLKYGQLAPLDKDRERHKLSLHGGTYYLNMDTVWIIRT